jgi:hypothetical protein
MKTCPACHKTYEDESMVFCLDDGARLIGKRTGQEADATWNLSPPPTTAAPPPTTVASPRPAPPTAQSTIGVRPEPYRTPAREAEGRTSRSSALPWVFAIVVVLAVSGVLIAWFMSGSRPSELSSKTSTPTPMTFPAAVVTESPSPAATVKSATPTERPSATPARELEKRPTPLPTQERPKPAFSMLNNTSFNGGSRITYYPRTSFGLCQADCAANASCRALTWIRPGAYNPGDAAMCYLMYSVTQRVSHACCISAVRN